MPADTGATTGSADDGPEDEGAEDPGALDDDGAGPVDLGSCDGNEDCVIPPGSCLEPQGHCDAGQCVHGAADPGVACDDGDLCTTGDACDGRGVCLGQPLACEAPHTVGGTCMDGMCGGFECAAGWGDCNDDINDGCETELGTDAACAACGDACTAGDNATASCVEGACQYSCQPPFDNCDGDWMNGCEVPVGVPHQCDATGLNPAGGCWTAYCGASADPEATNFGTFYCMDCATCREPASGECQWCNHTTGTFYPTDTCSCGALEDAICG